MKKIFIVLSIALVCVGVFYVLKMNNKQGAPPIVTNITNETLPDVATNQTSGINKPSTVNQSISTKPEPASIEAPIDKFDNISDLKRIRSLKLLQPYPGTQSWISDHVLVPFQLKGQNGKTVTFEANFVDAEIKTVSGRIQELELHSAWLDISQVRKIGSQLDEAFGLVPNSLSAWCDKIGDRKIDIQEFSSKAGDQSDQAKIAGYGIHPTFNNEKPLYISFVLRDR